MRTLDKMTMQWMLGQASVAIDDGCDSERNLEQGNKHNYNPYARFASFKICIINHSKDIKISFLSHKVLLKVMKVVKVIDLIKTSLQFAAVHRT